MQIVGLIVLGVVVWFGFRQRDMTQVSPLDIHAFIMVVAGSLSAVMVSSRFADVWRTFACLRELVPRLSRYGEASAAMETERETVCSLWRAGKRSAALELADKSAFPAIKSLVDLLLNRAPEGASAKVYLELRHDEIAAWQPAVHNWEMLSKLGPSFGMVGTITGMIQMFRNMSADNMNIGASMSLALTATLYGVAFGAGVAGPIGHFLNGLLDERLGFLERCEKSVNELVASGAMEHAAAYQRS